MFLDILSYLQPIVFLLFVYCILIQKKTAWLFAVLVYGYPFLREIVNINYNMPSGYYTYVVGNSLLYFGIAIWGMLAYKVESLRIIEQKKDYLKVFYGLCVILSIYLIINLISLPFIIQNFEANNTITTLYVLNDIFILSGLVVALLHYRGFVWLIILGLFFEILVNIIFIFELPQYYLYSMRNYYFLLVKIFSITVILYRYLRDTK